MLTSTRHPDLPSLISSRVGNSQNNSRQQHRSMPLGVVLTGYRLLTTIVVVGIGIPKAVYSYYGQSLISPSLDWVGGIIFTLLLAFISEVRFTEFVDLILLRLFWLGVIEATRPELCPSFFQVDLAPSILGLLGRDGTPSPLDPATLGSLRRGETSSPLAPEIPGVLSDDTSPPLIPEIPGVVGRDDASPTLVPEILGTLRRGDAPPSSGIYIPSSSNSSGPMSPTAQLAGTTPEHETIAPAIPRIIPDPKSLPSRFTAQDWSYRSHTSVLYITQVNNA